MYTGFWRGNLKERDHLEDLDVDERIILKGIFKKLVVWHGLDWSDCGQLAGSCECGNGPLGSIKCEEFLTG